MAIWLNYTHLELGDGKRLLPNYLFLLNSEFQPVNLQSPETKHKLEQFIALGGLKSVLEEPGQIEKFDDPMIWQILISAYPYEVELKYLQRDVPNDKERNESILQYFNELFAIDYNKLMNEYCHECNRDRMFQIGLEIQNSHYTSHTLAAKQFISFVEKLLLSQWFADEAKALVAYSQTHLHLGFEEGISGSTREMEEDVYINVGNMTYATLFHELAHFTNRFFRFHYYQNFEVCFDNYTKTNEWFANVVAYHLQEQIKAENINWIETMSVDPLYFSSYIDIYATLREKWSNSRKHNFEIIFEEIKRLEDPYVTNEKGHFYYERFYKFFHYEQHEYFYPKEMMYYLGYESVRKLFVHAADITQLLTQLFLGKLCV